MSKLISFEEFAELFAKGGMDVSEEQYLRLKKYAELLVDWNEKINLTAITDPQAIAEKHFYDSVYPFTLCGEKFSSLIDVGTGAGFPSLPLLICRGGFELTMLDSLNKRVNFLNEVTAALGLDAETVHGRAEEFGRKPDFREQFDAASARAVANLTVLTEYCLPFVKVGGAFFALKGKDGEAELNDAKSAIKALGGEVADVKKYALPSGDVRVLIVIRKAKATDKRYPRNAGQIKKSSH